MRLVHGAASHVGLVRRQNEDSFIVGGGLFAVCDGMGGARAGEVASELACGVLVDLSPSLAGLVELQEAVKRANAVVWRRSQDDPSYAGMGTTMTVVLSRDDALIVGHVGDSRAYMSREGRLTQLTDDHSLVAEMVRQGQLTPEQAANHPHRSIITRALGTEQEVEPDTFLVELEVGDRVLLCTDGLSGMVPASEISEILAAGDDPQAMADALVAAALAHGGEDNVTVVVVLAAGDAGAGSGGAGDGATGRSGDARLGGDERPRIGPAERAVEAPAGIAAARGLRRIRSRRVLLAAGGAVALLVMVAVLVGLMNSGVYFVGTSADGRVTLFQGMPYAPLGITMYTVVEVSDTALDSLEPYLRARVEARDLVNKEEGLLFIRGLEDVTAPDPGAGGSSVSTSTATPASPSTTSSTATTTPSLSTAPAPTSGSSGTVPTSPRG